MAKIPTRSLLIFLLTSGAVLGCGTVPGGPAASRTRRINVTGFSLPVAMAFSTDAAARAQVPQISPNSGSAKAFVKRLIVEGLDINVLYTPLPCPVVSVNPPEMVMRDPMPTMRTTCVIFGNTVTTTCLGRGAPGLAQGAAEMCRLNMPMEFTSIPPQHLSVSGTLTTSNPIMVTWNREMWQSVVNRVLRMITSGPFRTHFATAVATVS
ncbi:hypothetical protein KIN20_014313 [Parelaphostrongylus tenuis]|uniref:Lipoprotein n=1 Tax=Parelaphostrongylus tenuis TaxID=148309 RepID=A0AAD5MDF4_PARTN|nr:hypothetical protein KIN20_014313 [Parelaphostrongylus tenuis]